MITELNEYTELRRGVKYQAVKLQMMAPFPVYFCVRFLKTQVTSR